MSGCRGIKQDKTTCFASEANLSVLHQYMAEVRQGAEQGSRAGNTRQKYMCRWSGAWSTLEAEVRRAGLTSKLLLWCWRWKHPDKLFNAVMATAPNFAAPNEPWRGSMRGLYTDIPTSYARTQ